MNKLQRLNEFKRLLRKAQKKFRFEPLDIPNENGALGFSVKVRIHRVISIGPSKTTIVGNFFKRAEAKKIKSIFEKSSIRRFKEKFIVKIISEEYQLRDWYLKRMLGI